MSDDEQAVQTTERNSIGPTILERLNSAMGRGHEPVRALLELDGIRGKTIIKDEYERLLLTKMLFISERFLNPPGTKEKNMIIENFIRNYEEYGPAVAGVGREQFVETHRNDPPDILRNPEKREHGSANRRI